MATSRKITIIGLGLIGGSLGLALKAAASATGVEIVGHDRDVGVENDGQEAGRDRPRRAQPAARRRGRIARHHRHADHGHARGLQADRAGPRGGRRRHRHRQHQERSHALGRRVRCRRHVSFVGGHPMAGKETQGIEQAEATLFQGKAYCICPSVDATPERDQAGDRPRARSSAREPLFMDAGEHDQYAAAISHLPLVVSTALFTLHALQPILGGPRRDGSLRLPRHDAARLRRPGDELRHLARPTARR